MGRRSTADDVRALANAYAGPIEPPQSVVLREGDRPIWDAVMLSRSRDEWSDIDLYHAANLVRTLADIERISAEIDETGDVLVGDQGGTSINPRHGLLHTLSVRAEKLTRLLHLQANALVNDVGKLRPQRESEREARERVAAGVLDDDLLARPGTFQ